MAPIHPAPPGTGTAGAGRSGSAPARRSRPGRGTRAALPARVGLVLALSPLLALQGAAGGTEAARAAGVGRAAPVAPASGASRPATPAGAPARPEARPPAWVERTRIAMGTRLRVRVGDADRGAAIRATEAAFRAVEGMEGLLSTWRPDTELAALNAAPSGRPTRISRPLLELLTAAFAWSGRTGGAFDPVVGALVDAWGLRGEGRRPAPAELERARRSTGTRCFSLPGSPRDGAGPGPRGGGRSEGRDPGEVPAATRRCPGAWIDAGAFGKGAALREAREALRAKGASAGILDFGGQTLAFGPPPAEAERWAVEVAHPSRRGTAVARIRLRDASAATTGLSERGVTVEGRRMGHVLDPRTGRPVPAWGSVTVVHADPMTADLLSTALFVLGAEEGQALADRLGVAALFLVEGERGRLTARPSREMGRHLVGVSDGITPDRFPEGTDRSSARAGDDEGRTDAKTEPR